MLGVSPTKADIAFMSQSYCINNGVLVAGADWIPASRYEYNFMPPGPAIGCNNLQCAACGHPVRYLQMVHVHPLPSPEELYDVTNWLEWPGVEAGHGMLYSCQCHIRLVHYSIPLDELGEMEAEMGEELPPWSCGGHPPFELPAVFAGRQMEVPEDLANWGREILNSTESNAQSSPVHQKEFQLWRLYELVRKNTLGTQLEAVIAEALTHPEASVRLIALNFFRIFPQASHANDLLATYQAHAELYDNISLDGISCPLHIVLENTLRTHYRHSGDLRELELIRSFLLGGAPDNTSRWHFLRSVDRNWLENHWQESLEADPELLKQWTWHWVEEGIEELKQRVEQLEKMGKWAIETIRGEMETALVNHPDKWQALLAEWEG